MNAAGNIYVMHDKMHLPTNTRVRKIIPSYHNALGIMVHSQSLPWCPMHAIKKAMWTSRLPDKDDETNAMHE